MDYCGICRNSLDSRSSIVGCGEHYYHFSCIRVGERIDSVIHCKKCEELLWIQDNISKCSICKAQIVEAKSPCSEFNGKCISC